MLKLFDIFRYLQFGKNMPDNISTEGFERPSAEIDCFKSDSLAIPLTLVGKSDSPHLAHLRLYSGPTQLAFSAMF